MLFFSGDMFMFFAFVVFLMQKCTLRKCTQQSADVSSSVLLHPHMHALTAFGTFKR